MKRYCTPTVGGSCFVVAAAVPSRRTVCLNGSAASTSALQCGSKRYSRLKVGWVSLPIVAFMPARVPLSDFGLTVWTPTRTTHGEESARAATGPMASASAASARTAFMRGLPLCRDERWSALSVLPSSRHLTAISLQPLLRRPAAARHSGGRLFLAVVHQHAVAIAHAHFHRDAVADAAGHYAEVL